MKNFNSISEVMKQYVANIERKAGFTFFGMFARAILAGAMIALGAEASNVASHAIADMGVARTVAGAVFPIGLMMVIMFGAELFTGDCMLALGVTEKMISLPKFCKMLITIFFGNFVGGFLIALLTFLSTQFNYSGGGLGAYTIKVAVAKVNLSFPAAVSSGILCNILVCAAVLLAMCATDTTGKIWASFFIIFAFVISGFEHCVANMYYISAGIICKVNPQYVQVAMDKFGLTQAQLDSLNVGSFFLKNLLPVTIGNIIGGAIFVAIPLYYLNVEKVKSQNVEE